MNYSIKGMEGFYFIACFFFLKKKKTKNLIFLYISNSVLKTNTGAKVLCREWCA